MFNEALYQKKSSKFYYLNQQKTYFKILNNLKESYKIFKDSWILRNRWYFTSELNFNKILFESKVKIIRVEIFLFNNVYLNKQIL